MFDDQRLTTKIPWFSNSASCRLLFHGYWGDHGAFVGCTHRYWDLPTSGTSPAAGGSAGGFLSRGATPKTLGGLYGKLLLKRMMTGGIPIFGKPPYRSGTSTCLTMFHLNNFRLQSMLGSSFHDDLVRVIEGDGQIMSQRNPKILMYSNPPKDRGSYTLFQSISIYFICLQTHTIFFIRV